MELFGVGRKQLESALAFETWEGDSAAQRMTVLGEEWAATAA